MKQIMKKLMFAAAAAAMIGGVEAAGFVNGFGAYDFAATLKTTKGVKANLKAKSNDCLDEDGTYFVRKQATVKIAGLIWGCYCPTIAESAPFTGFRYNGEGPYDGSAFWNTTDKVCYDVFGDDSVNTLAWDILNRIDTTAKKVEGLWNLTLAYDSEGTTVESFNLTGAGFGTAAGALDDGEGNSLVYIPSISGYVVGTRYYTCEEDGEATVAPCSEPGEKPTYDLIWWALCDCGDGEGEDTIAYGSWSIKFNSTVAKRGSKNAGMNESIYNFPAYVSAKLLAYDPDPDPTTCDVLAAAVKAREADVKTAEAAVEATKYENLKAVETAANKAVIVAGASYEDAVDACNATNTIYQASDAAYEKALYQQTNVNAKIIWVNSSQIETTNDVVGCAAITAFIADKTTFTLVKMETTIPGLYGTRTCFTWAQCTALVKEFAEATEAAAKTLATDKENLKTAEAAVVTANAEFEKAQDALKVAQNNLANMTLLQVEAAKALSNAQDALTAAQAAYDAVCED